MYEIQLSTLRRKRRVNPHERGRGVGVQPVTPKTDSMKGQTGKPDVIETKTFFASKHAVVKRTTHPRGEALCKSGIS